MRTGILLATSATAALALAATGCGGSDSGSSGISAGAAKAAVERAADLHLAPLDLPGEAKREGVVAAYSNTPTVSRDKQFVFLFALKDAGTLAKAQDMLKTSFGWGPTPYYITRDNLMVFYAPAGHDHTVAVAHAVNALDG